MLRAIFGLCVISSMAPLASAQDGGHQEDLPDLKKVYREEFIAAFKKERKETSGLKVFASEPERVRYEENGLRITLPAGTIRPRPGDGVATDFGVKGNFDIAVAYEFIKQPASVPRSESARYPTDLKMVVVPLEPAQRGIWQQSNQNRASLSREFASVDRSDGFVATVSQWRPPRADGPFAQQEEPTPNGIDQWNRREFSRVEPQQTWPFPAKEKSGRLRMVRSGFMLFFYGVDGDGDDFKLLTRQKFHAKELRNVRVLAATGGPGAELDVRITDLVIRGDAFQKAPTAPFGPFVLTDKDLPAPSSSKWAPVAWLLASLLAVGLAFEVRRNVANRGSAARAGPAATIEFVCAGCGTRLKVKSALAGKKVQCPQCAAAPEVPAAPKEEKTS
jgi:hypothetical protein